MAKKILNLDLEVIGKLNLSTVPNSTGDVLTFNGLNQVTKRTTAEMLSDIGAAPLVHTHLIEDITDFTDNSTNWDMTFGWGDHSIVGYLTSVDISDINTTGIADATTYLRGDGSWQVVAEGGGTWGIITGTISDQTDLQTALDDKLNSLLYTASDVLSKLITVDGSGSGLDADLLDGLQSTSFLRVGASFVYNRSDGQFVSFRNTPGEVISSHIGLRAALEVYQDTSGKDAFMAFHSASDYALYFGLDGATNDLSVGGWSMGNVKHKVWHAGNDGSGSGLDADTLDGVQGASYLRSDTSDDFTGFSLGFSGDTRWIATNTAFQRGDARDEGTTLSRMHWYGVTNTGSPSNFRHAYYDGAAYINITAQSGGIVIGGGVNATRVSAGYDSGVASSVNASAWFRSSGTTGWFNATYGGGIYQTDSTYVRVYAGKAFQVDNIIRLTASGNHVRRDVTDAGYLCGSYSQDGSLKSSTGAIYCMGTSFTPTATDLANMYGIGYGYGTMLQGVNGDLGTAPLSQWGMYVAADGEARWWCNATSGITRQKGAAYASNFILNSDIRRKNSIEDYDPLDLDIKWKSFELNTEKGIYRVGVIAQELLKTNPEFVDQNDPESLTVKYIDLLCAKMAEKDKQVDSHSAALTKKDKQIESLEKRIDRLEGLLNQQMRLN